MLAATKSDVPLLALRIVPAANTGLTAVPVLRYHRTFRSLVPTSTRSRRPSASMSTTERATRPVPTWMSTPAACTRTPAANAGAVSVPVLRR